MGCSDVMLWLEVEVGRQENLEFLDEVVPRSRLRATAKTRHWCGWRRVLCRSLAQEDKERGTSNGLDCLGWGKRRVKLAEKIEWFCPQVEEFLVEFG